MLKQILMLAAAATLTASAGVNTQRLHITDLAMHSSEESVTINMTINPRDYKVANNKYIQLTPLITSESDTLSLPSVTVAGRHAWYYEVRSGNNSPRLMRAGKGKPYSYSATVPYAKWMDISKLEIKSDTLSECNCNPPVSSFVPIGEIDMNPPIFIPKNTDLIFDFPTDSVSKTYTVSGKANIIFKVNKIDIDWSYMSNYAELDSILQSINAVRDNEYATVESILLTGYASPEGSYTRNEWLAQGRTETVKKYVMEHSTFPANVYKTASVAEDWAGLREWLVNNNSVPNRDAMIAFIDDSSIPIEVKNDRFSRRFPNEYHFLLQNVYPQLRHTDYKITYKIKKFYDLDEIEHVLNTDPRLLTLDELYLLAGKYKPGSPEYDNVYITAGTMFPDIDIANLNAASSSLSQGNLKNAKRFLERVKPSPQLTYTWGLYYAMMKDYDTALQYLRQAKEAGVDKASEIITDIESLKKPSEKLKEL